MTKIELLSIIKDWGIDVTPRTIQNYAQAGLITVKEKGGGAGIQTEYEDYAVIEFLIAYNLMNNNRFNMKITPEEVAKAKEIFSYIFEHVAELKNRNLVEKDSFLSERLNIKPKDCLVAQEYLSLYGEFIGDKKFSTIAKYLTQFYVKVRWEAEQ